MKLPIGNVATAKGAGIILNIVVNYDCLATFIRFIVWPAIDEDRKETVIAIVIKYVILNLNIHWDALRTPDDDSVKVILIDNRIVKDFHIRQAGYARPRRSFHEAMQPACCVRCPGNIIPDTNVAPISVTGFPFNIGVPHIFEFIIIDLKMSPHELRSIHMLALTLTIT